MIFDSFTQFSILWNCHVMIDVQKIVLFCQSSCFEWLMKVLSWKKLTGKRNTSVLVPLLITYIWIVLMFLKVIFRKNNAMKIKAWNLSRCGRQLNYWLFLKFCYTNIYHWNSGISPLNKEGFRDVPMTLFRCKMYNPGKYLNRDHLVVIVLLVTSRVTNKRKIVL